MDFSDMCASFAKGAFSSHGKIRCSPPLQRRALLSLSRLVATSAVECLTRKDATKSPSLMGPNCKRRRRSVFLEDVQRADCAAVKPSIEGKGLFSGPR